MRCRLTINLCVQVVPATSAGQPAAAAAAAGAARPGPSRAEELRAASVRAGVGVNFVKSAEVLNKEPPKVGLFLPTKPKIDYQPAAASAPAASSAPDPPAG
jgi:hypothetical protein